MIYKVKYVLSDINLNVFNMIKKEMNRRHKRNMFYANVNVNLMMKNIIRFTSEIRNYVDVSSKI